MCKFGSTNPQRFLAKDHLKLFSRFIESLAGKIRIFRTLFDTRSGRLIIFVLFCMCSHLKAQQDPQYSQNMFNLLAINPAYAGSSEMVNLQLIQRQQWLGLEGRPITTVAGIDGAVGIKGIESGIGLHFMNDQLGFLNNNLVALSGAVKLRLNEGVISGGISLSVLQQVLDPKSWQAGPDLTASIAATKLNGTLFDVGLGAYYKSEKYYGGFSIQHMFNPVPRYDNDAFFYLKRCYYLTGGYNIAMDDRPIVWMPSLFLKTDAVSFQADINCNIEYKKRYWGGLSYRLQDAIVLLGGMQLKSGLKIGCSYDIPASRFSRSFGGSFEMFLGYTFKLSVEKKLKKYKSVRYL